MATTSPLSETAAPPAPASHVETLIREALHCVADRWHDEAILACEQALKANPLCAEALHLMGLIAYDLEEPLQGIKLIEKAHELAPGVQEFAEALAALQVRIGKVNDGLFYAKLATTMEPHPTIAGLLPERFGSFFKNLEFGRTALYRDRAQKELAKGDFAKAIANCERQSELTPGDTATLRLLARAACEHGQSERAVAAFRAVLHGDEAEPEDLSGLARALSGAGRHDEALACHEAAIDQKPDDPALHSRLLADLVRRPGLPARNLAEAYEAWQARHGAAVTPRPLPADLDRDPERPLRVAYISAAFHANDLMQIFEPVLRAHRRNQVTAYCYSTGRRLDPTTESLMRSAGRWTDITGIDDETLWQILRGDGIDIVVDLDGHRDGGRPLMLARRPAPLAVSWLGSADPQGGTAIDHVLTDETAWPRDRTEAVAGKTSWRMPRAALVWRAPGLIADLTPLPARQSGHVTFGVSCDLGLIAASTAAQWAGVLRAVEGARLLICNRFDQDQAAIDRCLECFANMGLRDQVDVVNMADNFASPFDFYQHVDLALDAGTSCQAIEIGRALWMGVPALSLAGAHHAGRLGASLLSAAGHPEWAVASAAKLAERAAELAADLDHLAALRQSLRGEVAASELADVQGFTRALEEAYRAMWRSWCASAH